MAKINISAATVKQAIDDLLLKGTIDQDGYDSIWWYYNHCQSNDWTQARASKEIKRSSWSTLYRVFHGKYEAGYESVIDAINRVKIIQEQRAKLATSSYIKTSTYTTISDICLNTLIGQEFNTINGNSQIGKTAAIMQFISRNPDKRIIYLRTPACPGKTIFYNSLAKACYIANATNTNQLRTGIKNTIDSRTLVIIDEAHQIFLGSEKAAVSIMEYLREIFDERECGMLLVGTNVLCKEMTKGKQAKLYGQVMMRGLIHKQLPEKTPQADIRLATDEFGYDSKVTSEADKVLNQINAENGFGVILKMLKAGATLSKKRNQQPNWDNFVESWVTVQNLSRNNEGDQ